MEHNNTQQSDMNAHGKRATPTGQEQIPAAPLSGVLKRLGLPSALPGSQLPMPHLPHEPDSALPPAESIAEHTLAEASIERLIQALRDEHPSIRMAAIQALSWQGEYLPIEPLLAALYDPAWQVRALAVLTLRQGGERVPVAPLVHALYDEDETVRAAAVRALGALGERAPVQALEHALHDSSWQVREAAVLTIVELGKLVPAEWLLAAINDPDSAVRESALLMQKHTSPEVITTATINSGTHPSRQTDVLPREQAMIRSQNEGQQAGRERERGQSGHRKQQTLRHVGVVMASLFRPLSAAERAHNDQDVHKRNDQITSRAVNSRQATSSIPRFSRRALLVAVVVIAATGIVWSLLIHSLYQRHTALTTTAQGPAGVPFYGPGYSVLDAQGNLYVLDADLASIHTRVLKFSPTGSVLFDWHPFPAGDQLSGIAVSRQSDLYVSVQGENTIYILSPTGTILKKWNMRGQVPAGLAVDSAGNVYVALMIADTIQKYSPSGTLLATWGQPGTALGQFRQPTELAVDRQGALYVVDAGNNRVQKLSPQGVPLQAWGSVGNGPGQFRTPGAIAVDGQGDVYVTDGSAGRVQKFSPTGILLAEWGNTQALQFNIPRGVAVSAQGTIYVSSANSDGERFTNGRITQLSPTGKVLAIWK